MQIMELLPKQLKNILVIMKNSRPIISISSSPFVLLFIVFLVLKLCNVIAWPWFFIFLPLIAWPAIAIIFFLFYLLILGGIVFFELIIKLWK